MKFYQSKSDIDSNKYIIATYILASLTSVKDAAWSLAIGQSIGNPNVRNSWESNNLFLEHSCIILDDEIRLSTLTEATVSIAFPVDNGDWKTDGISQLLCHTMGGHTDINIITKCRLISLELPPGVTSCFLGPKFGLTGIRQFVNQHNKPLLGGIIKPKVGISPDTLLTIVKQLVEGGADFIKEDEIMSNPSSCPLEKRVSLVSNYLASQSRKVVFCHTVNSDPHVILDRVKTVYQLGGNGVHVNVWSGLGVFNSIRKLDLPLFVHFQKSGDKVFTDPGNKFSIAWPVVCQLAVLMGIDTIQTGMLYGYSNDDSLEVEDSISIIRSANAVPALSCGMHPGIVNKITEKIGNDYLANVGGAIHGHPGGSLAGTLAMRQAIDEDYQATNIWRTDIDSK